MRDYAFPKKYKSINCFTEFAVAGRFFFSYLIFFIPSIATWVVRFSHSASLSLLLAPSPFFFPLRAFSKQTNCIHLNNFASILLRPDSRISIQFDILFLCFYVCLFCVVCARFWLRFSVLRFSLTSFVLLYLFQLFVFCVCVCSFFVLASGCIPAATVYCVLYLMQFTVDRFFFLLLFGAIVFERNDWNKSFWWNIFRRPIWFMCKRTRVCVRSCACCCVNFVIKLYN